MDKTRHLAALMTALCAIAAPASFAASTNAAGLPAFRDDAALEAYLAAQAKQAEARRRQQAKLLASKPAAIPPPPPSPPASVPLLAPGTVSQGTTLDTVSVTGTAIADNGSITNNQTTGVDEGDIVKRSGDFLIVLRRGRLFTLRIGDGGLAAVSTVNAYGPGIDPGGSWYDEMLVSKDRVVVIGYSYARGGTEIGVFELARNGTLRHRDTYQLRGSDYYSASNYASRLVGHTLVFYTPIDLAAARHFDLAATLPALRRWKPGSAAPAFKRILPANRIHRSPVALDPDDGVTLHSVSQCDLATAEMQCTSTAVLGPPGRVFYVSADAVYVWTTPWEVDPGQRNASFVVRMPFDGTTPTGLRASGAPIDQMSFLQRDGWLNVLVGSDSAGEAMWASKGQAGDLALLRVPLSAFGDGRRVARRAEYRALPEANAYNELVHNRFVGDWLLYSATSWGAPGRDQPKPLHAIRYADGKRPSTLALGHAVERIDALGNDGIAIGAAGRDLAFTTLRLGARAMSISRYTQPGAAQGDDRTHGFFYKPQDDAGGLLGLPVITGATDANQHGAASVLFLRNQSLRLSRAGDLRASDTDGIDDSCKASCVDWYGNARPIFVGDRVFALLGYELVEGTMDRDGRIRERRRLDFAPRAAR